MAPRVPWFGYAPAMAPYGPHSAAAQRALRAAPRLLAEEDLPMLSMANLLAQIPALDIALEEQRAAAEWGP